MKRLIPRPLRPTARKLYQALFNPSPETIFSGIYRGGVWGTRVDFDSGPGSHDPIAVEPYVHSVADFLDGLPEAVVVDLGCGNFNVGRRLVGHTKRFIGCDVVDELIQRNRRLFPDVEFRRVDITQGPLPKGDVCLVRQVFQHLNNQQIIRALQLIVQYPIWIVTEHVPTGDFVPNHDIVAGGGTRMSVKSGVDLSTPPFDFHGYKLKKLCSVKWYSEGQIRTEVLRRA